MSRLVRVDQPRPTPPGRQGYRVRGPIAPVFVERGALAPADAIAFQPSTPHEVKAFEAMRRAGVIRQVGGEWWLDIVAYQAVANARSRAVVPWLIGGAVVTAALATLLYQG